MPAKLQGKLSYSYGNDEALKFETEFINFNVAMEGGVESTWNPRVDSIDIKNSISPCGDDGTADKSIFSIFFAWIAWWSDRFTYPLRFSYDTGYGFLFYK